MSTAASFDFIQDESSLSESQFGIAFHLLISYVSLHSLHYRIISPETEYAHDPSLAKSHLISSTKHLLISESKTKRICRSLIKYDPKNTICEYTYLHTFSGIQADLWIGSVGGRESFMAFFLVVKRWDEFEQIRICQMRQKIAWGRKTDMTVPANWGAYNHHARTTSTYKAKTSSLNTYQIVTSWYLPFCPSRPAF